jgi:hypothetical protein
MKDRFKIHLLHLGAILALRTTSAPAAARAIRAIARRWFAPMNHEHARLRAADIEPFGTCLSRAITVAALLPRGNVVIGVQSPARGFQAHAWVEVEGEPLRTNDVSGEPIAML